MKQAIMHVWGSPLALLRWQFWNLFLALLPCLLGALFPARQPERWGLARRFLQVAVLLIWLALLPNTCYLFTALRHVAYHIDQRDLYVRCWTEPAAREGLAFWAAVGLVNLVAGSLTFLFGIRSFARLAPGLADRFQAAPALCLLAALGVDLGLKGRMNSWTLVADPAAVLNVLAALARSPARIAGVLAFTLLLWLLYETLEACAAGLALRWRQPDPKPAPQSAGSPAAQAADCA